MLEKKFEQACGFYVSTSVNFILVKFKAYRSKIVFTDVDTVIQRVISINTHRQKNLNKLFDYVCQQLLILLYNWSDLLYNYKMKPIYL